MIGYIDIALGAFIKLELDPKFTVAMCEPEVSRQGLAKAVGQANRGVPGVTYWRRIVDPGAMQNRAQASHPGIPQGVSGSTYYHTREIERSVEYMITAWVRDYSDRDYLEKAIAFWDVYQTITASVKDAQGNVFSVKFPLFTYPCTYSYDRKHETGEVLFYGLNSSIKTEGRWVIGAEVPRIETVITNYQEFVTGSPIDDPLLEKITITTDPPADPQGDIVETGEP